MLAKTIIPAMASICGQYWAKVKVLQASRTDVTDVEWDEQWGAASDTYAKLTIAL